MSRLTNPGSTFGANTFVTLGLTAYIENRRTKEQQITMKAAPVPTAALLAQRFIVRQNAQPETERNTPEPQLSSGLHTSLELKLCHTRLQRHWG